jgi:lipoprotein-anchoring transpeptidase ErfK/SrfK
MTDMATPGGGRLAAVVGTLLATAIVWGLAASPACAMSIQAPADATSTVDVTARLEAGDSTGTVLLILDGKVVAQRAIGASGVTFSRVSLAPGPHRFRVAMRGAAGPFSSTHPWARVYAWGPPEAPKWVCPAGAYVASPLEVRAYAGPYTSRMTLTVNGTTVGSVACSPGELVRFGRVSVGAGSSTYAITAENPFGSSSVFTTKATRTSYPYATCIIVDKSDFKLYWIRDNQLVKTYPIAHGRGDCTPLGVWKILAKYRTDPGGIYGPRKMRMFRRVGRPGHYSYVYTAYGIHGTNQPWVIGTMASHGCIRMYNRDVLELWPQVPLGTMVITRQ